MLKDNRFFFLAVRGGSGKGGGGWTEKEKQKREDFAK